MVGTSSEIFPGHCVLVLLSFVDLSLSVILVFFFVFLKRFTFTSINFQFPFISFAVKLIPTVYFAGVALLESALKIFLSIYNLQCSQYYSRSRFRSAVQMNAEFMCVCAKCMLLFH